MSVAFRRESDEEHKEPRFELPLPPGPNLVTARGYQLIRERNDALEVEIAAAETDERRAELERDLRYWRTRLATAEVAPLVSGENVAIGTRVTLEHAGRTRVLTIVGHDEAEPSTGLVSFGAPLARAMIGAEVGDEVELPGGTEAATIISIEALPH